MQVGSATAAVSAGTQASAASPPQTLDYSAFLRLLIAQMQNQDPMNPIDSTEYMSQLASFSSVEQAVKTNSKLDALLTSTALTQAEGMIGQTVTSADGSLSGQVSAIRITADGAVALLSDGRELALGAGVTVSRP
jgi:flagellar basal-body rod modification protein FlgD